MFETLQAYMTAWDIGPETLSLVGVGVGAMLLVFGLFTTFTEKDPVLRRMQVQANRNRDRTFNAGILKHADATPSGLMKTFIPTERKEQIEARQVLEQAGYGGKNAVRNFYILRVTFGVLLPLGLFVAINMNRAGLIVLPEQIANVFGDWSQMKIIQVLTLLVAAGFFGPLYWVRYRASQRRRAIEDNFPNALDLVQISVEAGMGFDAAMVRVGNEIQLTAPELSYEFLSAQREIQAGRNRETALMDMAARTGVDEVSSFANVVLQSMQFGTSISETLTAYAKEMRLTRELRAQEKANRLPVLMSAVLASLMLPALVLLTLGPVVIRYMRFFAN